MNVCANFEILYRWRHYILTRITFHGLVFDSAFTQYIVLELCFLYMQNTYTDRRETVPQSALPLYKCLFYSHIVKFNHNIFLLLFHIQSAWEQHATAIGERISVDRKMCGENTKYIKKSEREWIENTHSYT